MSRLEKLRNITTLNDCAKLLGYKPQSFSYILYRIPDNNKYIEFEILKRNGDTRKIKAPTEKLKLLQRRLADLLNWCYEEIYNKDKERSLSHGFRKNHSIFTNAKQHKNKRYVFNIDLKDFFPSINFGRVRGFFIKNHHFALNTKIATLIAQIACYNNELPQGSPCSPIISNFIGNLLDIRMVNLAKSVNCTYSRYVDDLTFSTNKKDFPPELAIMQKDNDWIIGNSLKKEIEKVGFIVNDKKISMQYRTSRQVTTGLVVNKKVNIKKEYYRKTRSMCYELFKTGQFYIDKNTQDDIEVDNNNIGKLNKLEGILSFIYKIKRPYDNRKPQKRRNNGTSMTKLYRSFLFYKNFSLTAMPLIITEGKTDIIYLKTALKNLANHYNEFVEIKNDITDFKIKFFNMSKNFRDVFAISKGTSGLKNLMDLYKKNNKKYKVERKNNPVIILIDNDDGSNEIKKVLKKEGQDCGSFYYFTKNLYVLLVSNRKNRAIENLFDEDTLKMKINGKVFGRAENIDPEKEYGKIVFAEKVVRENQKKINFDGFKEVFDNLKMIINDYQSRIPK